MNILHGEKSLVNNLPSEEDNEENLDQTRVYDNITANERVRNLDSPPRGSPAPTRAQSQFYETMNTQKTAQSSGPILIPELSDAEKHVEMGLQAAVPAPNEQTQPSGQAAPTHSAADATSGEFQTPALTSDTERSESKVADVVQPRRNPRREAARGPAHHRSEVAPQLQATPQLLPQATHRLSLQKDAVHSGKPHTKRFLHTSSTVSSDGSPAARHNEDRRYPPRSLLGPVNLPASMRAEVAEENARISDLPSFHRVTEPISYESPWVRGVNVVPLVPPGLNAANQPATAAMQQYGAHSPRSNQLFPPPFDHQAARETADATGLRNTFTATQSIHAATQSAPFVGINSSQSTNYLQQYQGAQPPHSSYFQFGATPLQGTQRSGLPPDGRPRNFMQAPQISQGQCFLDNLAHAGWPATNQPWGHHVAMMDVAPGYGVTPRNLAMRPSHRWVSSQFGQDAPQQMIHPAAAQTLFMPDHGTRAPVVDSQGGHVASH